MAKSNIINVKDCVAWWKAQVGKPCGKTNEYSAFMDSYKFYNYPKNGAANSCAIFYDTAIMKNMKPEPDANKARAILCEPNIDNCGAGCTQKVQYYKSKGRWISQPSKATTGDEIFFKKSNGAIYHTGAVVDWNNKGFYVVEGNTNGGMVAEKFYSYSDPKIAGFGRPDWYMFEVDIPDEIEFSNKLIVSTQKDPLRLRLNPSLSAPVMCLMKKGTIVEFISDHGDWYKVKYKSMIGYAYKDYLKKV